MSELRSSSWPGSGNIRIFARQLLAPSPTSTWDRLVKLSLSPGPGTKTIFCTLQIIIRLECKPVFLPP